MKTPFEKFTLLKFPGASENSHPVNFMVTLEVPRVMNESQMTLYYNVSCSCYFVPILEISQPVKR